MTEPLRIGVLTVSDGVHAGTREDISGSRIREWVADRGYELAESDVVPDETARIVPILIDWCDSGELACVLSTGGTGLAPRDVTPEATRAVLDRDAPGLAEALRATGRESTPFASLSRGLAGVRGSTLVVNLPGSPGAVSDGLAVLEPLIEHIAQLLRGDTRHAGPPSAGAPA